MDKNRFRGRGYVHNTFNPVNEHEKLEILEYIARMTYFYEIMVKNGVFARLLDVRLVFEKSYSISTYVDFNRMIKLKIEICIIRKN